MSLRILIILTLCLISPSPEIEETSIKLLFNSPLYLDSPSEESSSITGKSLVQLINKANQSIHFAIYGIRNQPEVLNALLRAKNRGVEVYGVVDKVNRKYIHVREINTGRLTAGVWRVPANMLEAA